MKINIKFELRDWWMGAFFDTQHRRVWVCLMPCFPIRITFGPRCKCGGAVSLQDGQIVCSKCGMP